MAKSLSIYLEDRCSSIGIKSTYITSTKLHIDVMKCRYFLIYVRCIRPIVI